MAGVRWRKVGRMRRQREWGQGTGERCKGAKGEEREGDSANNNKTDPR